MKRNNYNNVGAKLNKHTRKTHMQQQLVLFGSIWEKIEQANFEMGLEGRVEVYEAEKGKEILGRGQNRGKGIEVGKDIL